LAYERPNRNREHLLGFGTLCPGRVESPIECFFHLRLAIGNPESDQQSRQGRSTHRTCVGNRSRTERPAENRVARWLGYFLRSIQSILADASATIEWNHAAAIHRDQSGFLSESADVR